MTDVDSEKIPVGSGNDYEEMRVMRDEMRREKN